MPAIQALPTWSAWNNANFTSSSGLTDSATGQSFAAGGLNPGDWFDATNEEAAGASFKTNGLLYGGRYRFVQVDSGATAAFVKTGTIGYMRAGNTVKTAVITNPGSGYTPGVYDAVVTYVGSGSGTLIRYNIGANGTITGVQVIAGGFGLTGTPTVAITAPAGSGGAIALQLGSPSNVVTSADKVTTAVRPVVFLNSIDPGNYGFVQELGTATVLGGAIGNPGAGNYFVSGPGPAATTGAVGITIISPTAPVTSYTIGQALDFPVANQLFKILLQYVPVVQD